MEEINRRQDELIEEFELLDDWMDRYALIIEMGNELPKIAEELKVPENLIEGCQSRVWIAHTVDEENRIHYEAESDAMIVQGIVAMLLRVLNDQKAEDIAKADLYFIDQLGLYSHLSPTRSNGLASMLKEMKLYAIAHCAKE